MWKGESLELLEATGYWIAIRAKLLHVVDDTFCSIPTDAANCCYLDHLTSRESIARYEPAKKKKGSDDNVSVASLMIKSVKGWKRERRELAQLELHTFPS